MLSPWFNSFILVFTGLFVIVDPFGTVPTILILTKDDNAQQTQHIILRACFFGAGILTFFALCGAALLRFLQIDMNAFRAAGGLLLMFTAMDMLRSNKASRHLDALEDQDRADLSMVPMAIPLLAGPGAITSVMVLASAPSADPETQWIKVLGAIALVFVLSYWVLRSSARLKALLGRNGITAIQRIMGLLLAALSFQFLVQGLVPLVRSI